MQKKAAICEFHKGQKLKYFCTEEKCNKSICQSCLSKHMGHAVKPLEIAMQDMKIKAEKAKKEAKEKGSPVKKEIKKVEIKKEEKKVEAKKENKKENKKEDKKVEVKKEEKK